VTVAQYTGWIRREGPDVIGEIVDSFGWKIRLTGTPGNQDGKACFVLVGTLGEIPASLRIQGLDDPPAPADPPRVREPARPWAEVPEG